MTSSGNVAAGGVKLEDILPAGCYYTSGTTTMNGVAVADIGGAMPFSVSGGQLISSPAQTAGVVLPGDANKVVIKFRVTTGMNIQVCNQATVTLPDADGTAIKIITDDPASAQGSTCFYSKPDLTVVASNDGIINCYHPTVTLTAVSKTPGLTYRWTGSGGFTAEGQSIVVNSEGFYWAIATGPTGRADVQVEVTRPFMYGMSVTVPGTINCLNNGMPLTVFSGQAYTYQWTGPNGFTSTSESPFVTQGGDYTITAFDSVSGCSNSLTVNVPEDKVPPQVTVTNTGPLSCANPTVTLSANFTNSSYQVLWSGPKSFHDTAVTTTTNTPGKYNLYVGDLTSGCSTILFVQVTGTKCTTARVTTSAQNATVSEAAVTQFTHSAYPNPVTSNSVIEFASPENTAATVSIYNTLGICEKVLFKGNASAGQHYKVAVPTNQLHAGIYYYIINAAGKIYSGRLLIVK